MLNSQRPLQRNANDISDLKATYARYIYHWPLFVIGLVLALFLGWFYMQIADPVYEINASILVKDEKKSPQQETTIQELNQQGSPNNAETEIQILTSKNLISRVVNELQLWATYTTTERMKVKDLYGKSPFKLKFITTTLNHSKKNNIDILIKSAEEFEIQNNRDLPGTYKFNEQIAGSLGEWKLEPSPLLEQYIGKVVTIIVDDPVVVANNYLKALDVHLLDKSTPTIGLTISDKLQKRGKDVLNYLIKDYSEITSAEEKRKTASTITFLEKRLSSLKSELDMAEKQVEGFRSSEGITDIESQSKVYLENIQANDSKLNEVNVQLSVIEGIERYVNSAENLETAPVLSGIGNEALGLQVENLSQLQLKRVALLATTPERNPIFEPINRQIKSTKASIRTSVQRIKSSLQNTKSELKSFDNKFENSIKKIPGQERQFIDMKRQQSIKENLYVYLLQKKEELELSNASTLIDARIVDNANVGRMQWPRPTLVYTIALLLGLGIPFMILYFRKSFNNSVLAIKDIKGILPIPILANISQTDVKEHSIVVNSLGVAINEQFRTLRINLDHLYKRIKGDVAQIPTSGMPIHNNSSIDTKHPPMYIIDGVKSNVSEYNSLLYTDIENVCFLNDDSYVSQYGGEALHGVVEVTTKDPEGNAIYPPITKVTKQANNKRLIAKEQPNGAISMDKKRPMGRVTLVTSSTSYEGKSFIVSNLASSMAASKRKTALLDMNFHKSSIADIFNLSESHPGLTDFLATDMDIKPIIQNFKKDANLDIITSGNFCEQSGELLEQGKLIDLINSLKNSYDEILIDSPSLHLAADTLIISELADVTLYVIRQNFTSKSELEFIRQTYDGQKFNEMNIVFNGIVDGKFGDSLASSYSDVRRHRKGLSMALSSLRKRL